MRERSEMISLPIRSVFFFLEAYSSDSENCNKRNSTAADDAAASALLLSRSISCRRVGCRRFGLGRFGIKVVLCLVVFSYIQVLSRGIEVCNVGSISDNWNDLGTPLGKSIGIGIVLSLCGCLALVAGSFAHIVFLGRKNRSVIVLPGNCVL